MRTTLKNVLSGKVVDKTFNAGTEGRDRQRRQAEHDVPVQGRHRLRLHGRRHLRPDPRAGGDRRRRRGLPAGEHRGRRRRARGDAAVRRAAGDPRARRPAHRPGPAGRPVHRRHEARHAGDRRADPGAAVHQHRRQAQGRHPRRPVPRPGRTDAARGRQEPTPDGCPQQGPQARRRRPLRGRPAQLRPAGRAAGPHRGGPAAGRRAHRAAGRGRGGALAPASTS